MEPALDDVFTNSTRFRKLSKSAKAALAGMLELLIPEHGDWTLEGTPKDLARYIGQDIKIAPDKIIEGLRELDEAGCLKREMTGPGLRTKYIIPGSIIIPGSTLPTSGIRI